MTSIRSSNAHLRSSKFHAMRKMVARPRGRLSFAGAIERARRLARLCATHKRAVIGWLLVVVALVAGSVGGLAWSKSGPSTYTATGTSFVMFNFRPSEVDPFSAQQFVTQRIDSYAQLGASPAILVAVQQDVPGYTMDELRSEIAVSAVPGTVLIEATVTDSNPYSAARLADSTLAQLAATVTAAEGAGGPQASPILLPQIQPAIVPDTASNSIDTMKLGIGVGAGVVLAAVLWWLVIRRRTSRHRVEVESNAPDAPDQADAPDAPDQALEPSGDADPEGDADPKALDRCVQRGLLTSQATDDAVEFGGRDPSSSRSIGQVLFAAGGARLLVLPLTGLCNLAIARLVTTAVGIDQFGVVMLVATLCQLLMFADLGTGAAVASSRAQLDGAGGDVELRGTVLTAVRTTLCASVILGFGAAALGVLGAWPRLLGIEQANLASSLNLSAVLALSAFAVALPFSVGEALLRGSGRIPETVMLQGISPPAALLLTVVFHQIGVPALAYSLVLPIGALIAAICCATRAWTVDKAAVQGLLGKILRPRRFPGVPIAATAVPMFIVTIGLPIALQSDRVVIAHRLAATSLSDYSYAAQLYIPLWSIASTAALALWPRFAKERSPTAAVREGWLAGVAILSGLGAAMAVCFLIFAPFLISWMSAGQASPGWSLLIAFALLLFVQAAHVTTGIFLIAPDQLRFQAVCVVALVVTNVPLSWILAPHLGTAGPVYASAITVLICQLIPGVLRALHITRSVPEKTLASV